MERHHLRPGVLVYGTISADLQSAGSIEEIVAWDGISGTIASGGSLGQVRSAQAITATITENGQPPGSGVVVPGDPQVYVDYPRPQRPEDKLATARMSLGDARQQAAVAAYDLESGRTARQEEIGAVLEQAQLSLGVMSGELTTVYAEADLAGSQGQSAIAELFATTGTENARLWSDAEISFTHAVGGVSAALASEADYQGRILAGYGQVLDGAKQQVELTAGKLRDQSALLVGAENAAREAESLRESVSLAMRPQEFDRTAAKLMHDFVKQVVLDGVQAFLKKASTVCQALSFAFPVLAPVAWTMTFANLCIGLSRAQNMQEALGLVTDLAKEVVLGAAFGVGVGVAGRMIGSLASTGVKALKAIPGLAKTGAAIVTGLAKSAMGLAGKAFGVVKRLLDCFPAGTKVVTGVNADGSYRTQSIESLRVGDLVLARDQNNPDAPLVYKPVVQTFSHTAYWLVSLEIADDASGNVEQIRATGEHPFYVEGIGWKQADALAAGDHVQMPDGAWATVQSANLELHPEGLTVYNLEVADAHTYFVEDGQGAQAAVWVHNLWGCGRHHFFVKAFGSLVPYKHRVLTWMIGFEHQLLHRALDRYLIKNGHAELRDAFCWADVGYHVKNKLLHDFYREYSNRAMGKFIAQLNALRNGRSNVLSVYDLFKAEYRWTLRNGLMNFGY